MIDYEAYREALKTIVQDDVFEVMFIKKDGKARKMKCHLTEATQQGVDPIFEGLLPVWDMKADGHRFVNLNTLIWLKYRGPGSMIELEIK